MPPWNQQIETLWCVHLPFTHSRYQAPASLFVLWANGLKSLCCVNVHIIQKSFHKILTCMACTVTFTSFICNRVVTEASWLRHSTCSKFLYPVRALYRHLEWRYHSVPWPSVTLPFIDFLDHMIKRINEASVSQSFDNPEFTYNSILLPSPRVPTRCLVCWAMLPWSGVSV